MAQRAVYVFEVKSIQSFLFAGGRLRDAVGASALVDGVAGTRGAGRWRRSLLDALIAEDARLAGGMFVCVLRRAAGSFRIAFFGADAAARAAHFQRLARLLVANLLPGADWVDALALGDTIAHAAHLAHAGLDGRRGLNAVPGPGASPIFLRAPRFGAAASHRIRPKAAGPDIPPEAADDALFAKQKAANTAHLVGRAFGAAVGRCPFDIEQMFTGYSGPRMVGVVHADGNRLGALVQGLNRALGGVEPGPEQSLSPSEAEYARALTDFSKRVEEATRAALAEALGTTVVPAAGTSGLWPARPLIQAGDDVLVVVRGDLALAFAETFLAAFAARGAGLLGQVLANIDRDRLPPRPAAQDAGTEAPADEAAGVPPDITACAGIAWVGLGQPFTDAHALAESLCKFAKRHAKAGLAPHARVPSALAFHRVSSSIVPDFEDALARNLTTLDTAVRGPITLTCGPYGVDAAPSGLPQLSALKSLYALYQEDGIARGPLRQLASLAYDSEGKLSHRFARLLDVLDRRQPATGTALRARLAPLTGRGDRIVGADRRSPLADVLALSAVGVPVDRAPDGPTPDATLYRVEEPA